MTYELHEMGGCCLENYSGFDSQGAGLIAAALRGRFLCIASAISAASLEEQLLAFLQRKARQPHDRASRLDGFPRVSCLPWRLAAAVIFARLLGRP